MVAGLRRNADPARRAEVREASVHNAIDSQVVIGDGVAHISILSSGYSRFESSGGGPVLQAVQPPVLATSRRPDLVGRDAVVNLAYADVAAGQSVQLWGATGSGRAAVAQAVLRRLGAEGVRGIQLLPEDIPCTLIRLYERLAQAFFAVTWSGPDEAALAAAVAAAEVRGVVFAADCNLDSDELDRLRAVFPDCGFLITSEVRTLTGDSCSDFEIRPLTRDQGGELLARELGTDSAGTHSRQLDEAYRLSEGKPQRLLQHAAFLRRAAERPERTARLPVSPVEQAALLIAGLGDTARQVLETLACYGTVVDTALLPAVTGITQARQTAADLAAAGLVRIWGSACIAEPESTQVFAESGIDPRIAAFGLMRLLSGEPAITSDGPGPAAGQSSLPLPSGQLMLAVARRLGNDHVHVSQFARLAAPAAVASGDLVAWRELISLGEHAAGEAGRYEDLAYFRNERYTDCLLRGDTVAAAAIFMLMSEALRDLSAPPLGALAQARAPLGQARGVVRSVRNAMPAIIAITVVLVVMTAVATAIVIRASGHAVASTASDRAPSAPGTYVTPGPSGPFGFGSLVATGRWTVVLENEPATPLNPTDAPFATRAQFPYIASGAPDAERARLDQLLQQPIVVWEEQVGQAVASSNQHFAPITGGYVGESVEATGVTEAGSILTVAYSFTTGPGFGSSGSQVIVLRTDTGTTISQDEIFTPAARTQAGLNRIAAALEKQFSAGFVSAACGPLTGSQLASGLADNSGLGDGVVPAIQVGVSTQGLEFMVAPGEQKCAGTIVPGEVGAYTVPFSQLTGLVSPAVLALADVTAPAASSSAPAETPGSAGAST